MTSLNVNPSRQEALLNAAASQDAKRYGGDRNMMVDPMSLTKEKASVIMSEEHRVLGHRPPPDSLASAAQTVAEINEKMDIPHNRMTRQEAARLEGAAAQDALRIKAEEGKYINVNVNPLSLSKGISNQRTLLGYPPPAGSLAAEAQSLTDRVESAATKPMTKDIASDMMSLEHRGMGYIPSGSIAAEAQSVADKNESDGGNRTMNPAIMRVAMGAPVSRGRRAQFVTIFKTDKISDLAAKVMSEENSRLGGIPRGSLAAQAQAAADKNVLDGGDRSVYDDYD